MTTFYGGDGNDVVDSGYTILYGGEGNDLLSTDQLEKVYIYGGGGDDFLRGAAAAGGSTLYGGEGNDALSGMGSASVLYGGNGDDALSGAQFRPYFQRYIIAHFAGGKEPEAAPSGDDYLDGGLGLSAIYGGSGNDTLVGEGNGYEAVTWYSGYYGAELNPARDVYVQTTSGLYGGDGNDVIFGMSQGSGRIDYVEGGAGDDALIALGADATSFYGGAGADSLYGGAGGNALYGGDGNDIVSIAAGAINIVDLGAGDDYFYGGSTSADTVYGGQGADHIYGGGVKNFLNGGDGDDVVAGGGGDDDLRGDGGDDAIFAGAGHDYLTGGDGTDFFYAVGNVSGGADVRANDQKFIMDFNASGTPDYVVLPAVYRASSLVFDQGGYTWIALSAGASYDFIAIVGGTSASAVQSQIIWS